MLLIEAAPLLCICGNYMHDAAYCSRDSISSFVVSTQPAAADLQLILQLPAQASNIKVHTSDHLKTPKRNICAYRFPKHATAIYIILSTFHHHPIHFSSQ